MNKNDFGLILAKFGRLLISDRFWIGVAVILLSLLGMPEEVVNSTSNQLDPQAQEVVLIVIKILALLGVPIAGILSIGIRPTSGLGKSDVVLDVDMSPVMRKIEAAAATSEPSLNDQDVGEVGPGEVVVKALETAGADFTSESE